jgi:hypothetical protein
MAGGIFLAFLRGIYTWGARGGELCLCFAICCLLLAVHCSFDML